MDNDNIICQNIEQIYTFMTFFTKITQYKLSRNEIKYAVHEKVTCLHSVIDALN